MKAPIVDANGNVFNLIAICSRELKKNGYDKEAKEMIQRIENCHDYYVALGIICEYVEPVKSYEMDEDIDISI